MGYFKGLDGCQLCAADCERCISHDYCYKCKNGDSFDGLCKGSLLGIYAGYITAFLCLLIIIFIILFKKKHK